MPCANWYFDYVSPYPYLHLARFDSFPATLTIRPVPVVFGGLLKHWENKAPVDIPGKRALIFRHVRWLAERHGLPFTMPSEHPFNPIALLRLTVALDNDIGAIRTIASHLWTDGNSGTSPESLARLCEKLGIDDMEARISDPDVKARLIRNGEEAIAKGVFGVPTYEIDGTLFWGDESIPQLLDHAATLP